MRRTLSRHQRGLTLVEVGIAIAMGVALVTVAVMSWQRVRENMMVEQAMAALDLAVDATRSVAQGATAPTAWLDAELIATNTLPESLIDRYGGTATVITPWGAEMRTQGVFSSAAAVRVDAAVVRVRGLPVNVCQRVLSAVGQRTLAVSDDAGTTPRAHQNDPLTAAEISAYCATAPSRYALLTFPM